MNLKNDKDIKIIRKIEERVKGRVNKLRPSIADMYHVSEWLINTIIEETEKVMKAK